MALGTSKNIRNELISPSIRNDIGISILGTILIFLLWLLIYYYFGDVTRVDTTMVSFFGAVLAIAGLMARQYLFRETLEYLSTWDRMQYTINKILSHSASADTTFSERAAELSNYKILSEKYSKYVKAELNLIQVIPFVLVFLYGTALLSEKEIIIRVACLILMLFCLVYLALAGFSSNRLAIQFPELQKTEKELEDLLAELEKMEFMK